MSGYAKMTKEQIFKECKKLQEEVSDLFKDRNRLLEELKKEKDLKRTITQLAESREDSLDKVRTTLEALSSIHYNESAGNYVSEDDCLNLKTLKYLHSLTR